MGKLPFSFDNLPPPIVMLYFSMEIYIHYQHHSKLIAHRFAACEVMCTRICSYNHDLIGDGVILNACSAKNRIPFIAAVGAEWRSVRPNVLSIQSYTICSLTIYYAWPMLVRKWSDGEQICHVYHRLSNGYLRNSLLTGDRKGRKREAYNFSVHNCWYMELLSTSSIPIIGSVPSTQDGDSFA